MDAYHQLFNQRPNLVVVPLFQPRAMDCAAPIKVEAMRQAARELAALGPEWVLVKGRQMVLGISTCFDFATYIRCPSLHLYL